MKHHSEVFKYTDYEDGPDVPVVMASQVGGIYRVGPSVIQVTLINQLIRDQKRAAEAVVHQIWHQDAFLECELLLRFAADHLKEAPPRKRLLRSVN
jgi:hypothetical protein